MHIHQNMTKKYVKIGLNSPKSSNIRFFCSKSRKLTGQNVHDMGKMDKDVESTMEHNKSMHSNGLLGRKSSKIGVLRAKSAKNGQNWPTKPTLGLSFTQANIFGTILCVRDSL